VFAHLAQVPLAVFDFVILDDAVKSFFRRLGQKFFGQSDVFFGNEAETEHDAAEIILGVFDAFGNLHFLFAGEQGDLAHLLEVHAHRVVQRVQPGLLLFLLGLDSLNVVQLGLVNDFDLEVAELREDVLDVLGGGQVVRQRFVQVVIGEIALLMGQADQLFDLIGHAHVSGGVGRWRRFIFLCVMAAMLAVGGRGRFAGRWVRFLPRRGGVW
jgi:hypothetical protein